MVRANVQNLLAQRVGREKAVCGRRKDAVWKRAGDSAACDIAGTVGVECHTEKAIATQA